MLLIFLLGASVFVHIRCFPLSGSVSQYVIVALMRAGIVKSSKYLLEQIIIKRAFLRKQNENREKMKETDLQKKLIGMQKSTDEQLDDRVAGKIDKTVPRTVMAILLQNSHLVPSRKLRSKSLRGIVIYLILVM